MPTSPPTALADRALTAGALVVDPAPAYARAVVDVVADDDPSRADLSTDAESDRPVRLLCTGESADAAFDDFLTATAAVEARSADRFAVRTTADLGASLTLADGTVRAHLSIDGETSPRRPDRGLASGDDGTLCAVVEDEYEERWRAAEPYALDVPGRTRLIESFADRWPDAAETLAALLRAAESLPRTAALDPVTACMLVGARHEVLAMELGDWAEEIGLSSRTEIARSKACLIEAGLVETRREPAGVGRPRHRLVLGSDAPTDPSGAELLARGRSTVRG